MSVLGRKLERIFKRVKKLNDRLRSNMNTCWNENKKTPLELQCPADGDNVADGHKKKKLEFERREWNEKCHCKAGGKCET